VLDAHETELRSQLEALTGKVECKIRVVYAERALMLRVLRENPALAVHSRSLRALPDDATYYQRIELGELVAKAVDRRREEDAHAILDALAPIALDVEVGEPAHERVVLSASFLLDRERVAEFDRELESIARREATQLHVTCIGPIPPYSFVELAGSGLLGSG
jgi:hypothetical protein